MEKDLNFLKYNYISNKGLYDNETIFENTLESFSAALFNNLIINLKLRLTKDKIIIVYEDSNLSRLMNLKDKINEITYDELLYLNKYHIPTLSEVLTLINGKVPIIINPKGREDKYYIHKETSIHLDNYKGDFAILSDSPNIINWYNKHKENYVIGEIIYKKRNLSFLKTITNCCIQTDFKSIELKDYEILKIKNIKETSLLLGYLADSQTMFDIYKDEVDNIFIDRLF